MDGNRKKDKKKNMRFKEFLINESIIDVPRSRYAVGVFDNAETENPKLKPKVFDMIKAGAKHFSKWGPVVSVKLIGSILGKRYRNDADLDIDVLIDIPEKDRETVGLEARQSVGEVSGKLVPGTQHPINYYVQTDPKVNDAHLATSIGVYDVFKQKFDKRPPAQEFDPKKYEAEFQKKVAEIDVVKGELQRDIVDYEELKELSPNDILNLQEKINEKLEEIEDAIEKFSVMGDELMQARRDLFNRPLTPEEIKKYGIAHKLPKNVVYKYLEKFHYTEFFKKCKTILDDGKVTDAEVDSLKTESIDSAWKTLIRKTIHAPRLAAGIQLYIKYMKQGMKDAKNTAAQHAGIDYNEFGRAIRDAGLPESYNFNEATRKSIAFTFGRFNPPTIGHEKLINKVASVSANDYRIYLSRSEDAKKNPLSANEKLKIMKSMFPRHARKIEINTTNMILDICTNLYKKGYTEIFMVVGSDRVREFETIINKYNDIKSRHGYYNFDNVNVLSAGERDPDAEGASGMSASKMRAAAAKGDMNSFKRGLPRGVNADDIMKAVRKGMRLAASFEPQGTTLLTLSQFDQQQVRDLYIREQIFNIGDKVKYVKEDIQGKVVRKGTNYIVLEDNNNNLRKCWIWDCIPEAADREAEVREYDLNIDYGFEAVSEKKESYEIGADYANHTKETTPGETPDAKPVDAKQRGYPSPAIKHPGSAKEAKIGDEKLDAKDVKEWAVQESTIDKYRERYKEEWESKLKEVVNKMLANI
jgi:hypothetical protein